MELSTPASSRAIGWSTFLIFLGAVWYGLWSISLPEPVSESAPHAEFSSARAMRHLRVIAAEPHPLGSAANAKVRKYLVDELQRLGIKVDVEESTFKSPVHPINSPIRIANIVGRLVGARSAQSVILACHYDSASDAPGAGDDGAAVAAILETARSLLAGPRLQNDVVILITDGEEAGLLGAQEFVRSHPLASRAGVIFNYDARGCGGPSILMETSPQNGRLIREFTRAARYRLGASVANEIYKRMQNSTDMTVFIQHEMDGLNFCFDKGLAHYHQPTDSFLNVDERSVQQIGANALALARHFGNLDLANVRDADEIFFNPWGMFFVHYPASWNRPLAILVIAVGAAGIVLMLKQRQLRIRDILGGIVAFLVSTFSATVLVLTVSLGMLQMPAVTTFLVNGDIPDGDLFLAGFSALSLAGATTCTVLFRRQLSVASLASGGMMIWMGLTAAASLYLPAACYQCMWPLAWGFLGTLGASLFNRPSRSTMRHRAMSVALQWLSLVAVVVQIAPIIYLAGITVGTSKAWITAVLSAPAALLLTPSWELVSQAHRWLMPVFSFVVAIALLLLALCYLPG